MALPTIAATGGAMVPYSLEEFPGGPGLRGVAASFAAGEAARRLGIPLTSLEEHPRLDLCVDGADEVDPKLNLIKGLGGALFPGEVGGAPSIRVVVSLGE